MCASVLARGHGAHTHTHLTLHKDISLSRMTMDSPPNPVGHIVRMTHLYKENKVKVDGAHESITSSDS
jgi:hypothetical protein